MVRKFGAARVPLVKARSASGQKARCSKLGEPKKHQSSRDKGPSRPKWAQVGEDPSRPKWAQGGPCGPKWAREGPTRPRTKGTRAQAGPKWAKVGPSGPQVGPSEPGRS